VVNLNTEVNLNTVLLRQDHTDHNTLNRHTILLRAATKLPRAGCTHSSKHHLHDDKVAAVVAV